MYDPTNKPSKEYELSLRKSSVQIDHLLIREEFIQLPGHLAFWNEKLAEATKAELLAEVALKRTEAKLSLTIRTRLDAENKKSTEAVVNSLVESNEEWINAKTAYALATVEKTDIRGVVDAIHAKREMLVSLGAHVRKEMDADPSLRREVRTAAMIAPPAPPATDDDF